MDFHFPRRVRLAQLPTPIEKLTRLSQKWGGPEVRVKRDDMTGMVLSGNKVRKLEFTAAQALDEGAKVLITCGGVQSNHARATAAAAAVLGLKCHLVLGGERPRVPEGNLFLDLLLGAQVTYVATEDLDRLTDKMESIAEGYRKNGTNCFIIPMGASDATGALGYAWAASEMKAQFHDLGFVPDHIVIASGSGGTQAGLLIGRELFGLSSGIVGINVRCDADYFRREISRITGQFRAVYHPGLRVGPMDIRTIDGYVGAGYARARPEELRFIAEVACTEGLLVDTAYTGKALYGLYREIEKGTFRKGEKVLFLHTGGLYGLMPMAGAFAQEVFAVSREAEIGTTNARRQ